MDWGRASAAAAQARRHTGSAGGRGGIFLARENEHEDELEDPAP